MCSFLSSSYCMYPFLSSSYSYMYTYDSVIHSKLVTGSAKLGLPSGGSYGAPSPSNSNNKSVSGSGKEATPAKPDDDALSPEDMKKMDALPQGMRAWVHVFVYT